MTKPLEVVSTVPARRRRYHFACKTLSILALGVLALLSGCITTKKGAPGGRAEIDRSLTGRYSYDFDVASISENGEARISLSTMQEASVTYATRYQKLKQGSRFWNTWLFTGLLLPAGWAALYKHKRDGIEGGSADPLEQEVAYGATVKHAWYGAVGYLSLGAIGTLISTARGYREADGYIYENKEQRSEEGSPVRVQDQSVRIGYDDQTVERVTDEEGALTLHLVEDFGLTQFDSPRSITITASYPEGEHVERLQLDPTGWTVPYARVPKAGIPLRATSSGDPVSEMQPEDVSAELKVLDTRGALLQVRLRGETVWVNRRDVERFWAVPTRVDPSRLPQLAAEVAFAEPSGNNKLDADEEATVRVSVTNTGQGPAYRVRGALSLSDESAVSHASSVNFGDLEVGETKERTFTLRAARDLVSGTRSAVLRFREANGFEPAPQRVVFDTRAFIPPELEIADVGIDDASGNGQIEPGELVEVTARIRNASRGHARDVVATINLGDNVFEGSSFQRTHRLGDLGPGAQRDVTFNLFTNRRATGVPVTVDLRESYGEFGRAGVEVPLAFNVPTGRVAELRVEGRAMQMAGGSAPSLSVDVDENLPTTAMDNPDAVAVVVGIRDYDNPNVPSVEYARRDATTMRRYLTDVLGYRPENILPRDPNQPMTAGALKTLVRQQLPNYLKSGSTSDVFVYFSGHGAPSTGERPHAYLVPADADPSFVSDDNAYRLQRFYEDLARLNTRTLTVMLDACFTGQSGGGDMLIRQASPLTLTVENPLLAQEQAAAFVASGPDEVANWYPSKKHGMFTYFFLKGLQGAGDLDGDGRLTVGEMRQYLTDEDEGVPYWSRREMQREQVPQVQARDDERVLVRYEER